MLIQNWPLGLYGFSSIWWWCIPCMGLSLQVICSPSSALIGFLLPEAFFSLLFKYVFVCLTLSFMSSFILFLSFVFKINTSINHSCLDQVLFKVQIILQLITGWAFRGCVPCPKVPWQCSEGPCHLPLLPVHLHLCIAWTLTPAPPPARSATDQATTAPSCGHSKNRLLAE